MPSDLVPTPFPLTPGMKGRNKSVRFYAVTWKMQLFTRSHEAREEKRDGYTKQLNHLCGEAPLFDNCLISLRLCVRWIAVFRCYGMAADGVHAPENR
jgi:hypothetical protein